MDVCVIVLVIVDGIGVLVAVLITVDVVGVGLTVSVLVIVTVIGCNLIPGAGCTAGEMTGALSFGSLIPGAC